VCDHHGVIGQLEVVGINVYPDDEPATSILPRVRSRFVLIATWSGFPEQTSRATPTGMEVSGGAAIDVFAEEFDLVLSPFFTADTTKVIHFSLLSSFDALGLPTSIFGFAVFSTSGRAHTLRPEPSPFSDGSFTLSTRGGRAVDVKF